MLNAVVPPCTGRWLATAILGFALALPACDNGPTTAATVELSAPTTTILVGQLVQITPIVKDKAGKDLTGRQIVYLSSAPAIAVVGSDGNVLGVTPGSAVITATVDGVTARLSIVVSPVPVSRIAMSRDTATVQAATTLQLIATPQDSAGHSLSDRTITWSSSDATVAGVSSSGLVSAVAAGSATITASTGGKSGTTRITVTPAAVASIDVTPILANVVEGGTTQLTATPKDAAGHVLTGRPLTWTSSDVNRATVSSSGLVTGRSAGIVNILVTSGSVFGSASVGIVHQVARSLKITPDTANVGLGDTLRLTVAALDSAGGAILFKPATWQSLDPTVVTVDSTGKVTGIAFGTTSVVASRDGVADTATISVTAPAGATLVLNPDPAVLGIGQSGRFVVTLRDASGNIITGLTPTYQIVTAGFVTVDTSGLFTAGSVGTTAVVVNAGGLKKLTFLTVSPVLVSNLASNPNSLTLAVGASATLAISVQTGVSAGYGRMISFASDDPTIATVTSLGTVTALKTGTTTIEVTSEGITILVPVTVQ